MEQQVSYQRQISNSQFGNNTTIHQDNNTITHHYNLHLPIRPVRAAIRIIPYPLNEDLVDRPDLTNKLDALLPHPSKKYCSAALWGLGGSGKTQIALNYAYQRCKDKNCSVFWVHADSEATFSQDYKTIARAFNIDENLKNEDLYAAVRDKIASQSDWVLIIDNADDLKLFGVGQTSEQTTNLGQYIPHSSIGTVLWTSRDARIAGTLVGSRRGIKVARMESDEAEELLSIARDLETNEEELETADLLEELQWLPLAITQAGAYMRRTSTSAKEYSYLLAQSKKRWQLLREEEFDRHRRDGVPNNVLETWSISIDRIGQENGVAYNILHVIAYVANQNISHEIITTTLLKNSDSNPVQPEKVDAEATKAITRLKEFSFIGLHKIGDGGRSYEMHKLVQEATRYGLSVWKSSGPSREISSNRDQKYFSSIALQVIRDLFPDSKPETWTQCEIYLAHAVQVGNWTDLNEKQIETSELFNRVSDFLKDRGRWREREVVNKKGLGFEQKVRGDKHPATVASMEHLATTYWAQGRYKEAEALENVVLEVRREVLGDKHPQTMTGMANLATTYYQQGRYKESETLEMQALDLRREILGDKHPDTIQSMANLGATYYDLGRYEESEALKAQVLELRREVLGDRHPETMTSMSNLALTYIEQGRYEEAEVLQVQVLDLRRDILGDKHPDTIRGMTNLASTYWAKGLYEESEALQAQVLDLRRDVLGEKHPTTILTMTHLASIIYSQGRYSEAESLEVRALALEQEILGKEHPDTLETMDSLACTWKIQGRRSDALALIQECVEYRLSMLGPEHPDTITSVERLEKWKSEEDTDTQESNGVDIEGEQTDGSEQVQPKSYGLQMIGRLFGWFL